MAGKVEMVAEEEMVEEETVGEATVGGETVGGEMMGKTMTNCFVKLLHFVHNDQTFLLCQYF